VRATDWKTRSWRRVTFMILNHKSME